MILSRLSLGGVVLLVALTTVPARATDVPRNMTMCTHPIQLLAPNTRQGCWLDVEMTRAGQLHLPCDGGYGPAVAIFGSRMFAGIVNNGSVSMTLATAFHYGDGCNWTTMQTITGRVNAPEFSFTYTESPRPNQSGCLPPCEARAVVRVTW